MGCSITGPRKFSRLRLEVNKELKNPSRRTFAKLYCLMACSGFRHKFDRFGNFKGEYFPHALDTKDIKIYNKKLINSDFILSQGRFNSLDKNLLTQKSLIYINIPFPSNRIYKEEVFEYFEFIDDKKLDFLVTARIQNRGLLDKQIKSWAKKYKVFVHSQFKDDSFSSSDIFIFNNF